LSTKTDHPEGPSILPEPELNPLLNPLLGQHMGRWAEVYFTSPPEKREQAVTELLHELQAGNPSPGGPSLSSVTPMPKELREPIFGRVSEIPEASSTLMRCHACGQENPAPHRFCGMCGSPVLAHAAGTELSNGDRRHSAPASEQNNETRFVQSEEVAYEPVIGNSELSLFQGGGEASYRSDQNDVEDELFSYPSASRSYRVYIGIALATVMFGLAYMAWRSAQGTAQNSHVESQAPPAVTQPAAPAPVQPSTPKSDTAEQSAPAETQAAPPASDRAAVDGVKAKSNKSAPSAASAPPVNETKPSDSSPAEYGAEELAIAQRYLTGANGQQRNSAEAAKWLWKSMAKHNSSATLVLADLYLKGDGVSKNCDQARVLLDSAARGGMKQAGERLRHLQAFGCE
jgi:TPR repeat protein